MLTSFSYDFSLFMLWMKFRVFWYIIGFDNSFFLISIIARKNGLYHPRALRFLHSEYSSSYEEFLKKLRKAKSSSATRRNRRRLGNTSTYPQGAFWHKTKSSSAAERTRHRLDNAPCGQVLMLPSRCLVHPAAELMATLFYVKLLLMFTTMVLCVFKFSKLSIYQS